MSPIIVIDRDIPYVEEIFSGVGRIVAISGHEIGPQTVKSADALIVRSITPIDETLLSGSQVQFVGSATAGMDHIDTEFLFASGIRWALASGANARSVVDYTLATMSVIASRRNECVLNKTLGVIGCGQVGERLARVAESLGMDVLRNDPPRATEEGASEFVDLSRCLAESDIISVHVPLTSGGSFPTSALLAASEFVRMKPGAWLVQSSRGGVVDEQAAVEARKTGILDALVLDVFEGEPLPSLTVIDTADLATGHIAGYSRDAKRAGALMMRAAVLEHFNLTRQSASSGMDSSAGAGSVGESDVLIPEYALGNPSDPTWMDGVVRQVYDVREDDRRFRAAMKNAADEETRAEAFHAYRANYPARYDWSRYTVKSDNDEEAATLKALGFATTRKAS